MMAFFDTNARIHTHTRTYDRVHTDISICASLALLACRARLRDSYEDFALKKLPVRSKRPNYSCQAVACHFRRCRDHRLSHRDGVPARPKSCGLMKNDRRTSATACVPPHPTPCWDSAEKQALDEGILAACHRNTLWWVITYHTHTPPYLLARDARLEPIIQCYARLAWLLLTFSWSCFWSKRNPHKFHERKKTKKKLHNFGTTWRQTQACFPAQVQKKSQIWFQNSGFQIWKQILSYFTFPQLKKIWNEGSQANFPTFLYQLRS